MNGVRNAKDFLDAYIKFRYRYEHVCEHQISDIREAFARSTDDNTARVIAEEVLEAHLREYLINCLLSSLNWRMGESLLPEAPIRSITRGSMRFMDYLGVERQTTNPLLVVETKHPRSKLPGRKNPTADLSLHSLANEPISSVIVAGLNGEELTGDWNEWLSDLCDYVRSVANRSRIPRRVVITSGEWFIIFADPADAFLSTTGRDANKVFIFTATRPGDVFTDNYRDIFDLLEYQRVLGEVPPLSIGEVGFHCGSDQADRVMHGLDLLYIEQPGFMQASPAIKVMPIAFVRLRSGPWIRVNSERDLILPNRSDSIASHLREIQDIAQELLDEINRAIGVKLPIRSIEEHFASPDFEALPGVLDLPRSSSTSDEHIVVTGQHPHYFGARPTIPNCRYHEWVNSRSENHQEPQLVPITRRSTDPRSYFYSGEQHHCAHNQVIAAKRSAITTTNKKNCGPRSGKINDPFCEIWAFEKQLCCRTCIFEKVCTKAEVFILPCPTSRAAIKKSISDRGRALVESLFRWLRGSD